jgi:hypothetical protein
MKRIAGILAIAVIVLAGCFNPALPGDIDLNEKNLPPSVDLSAETSLFLGDSLTATLTTSDPEGDPLSWDFSFDSLPPGSELETVIKDGATASFTPDVEGVYVLRVSVSDGTNEVSATLEVTVVSGVPAEPTAPSPGNGATGVGIANGLDWNDTSGATSYELYLGTDSLPTVPTETLPTSSYAPPEVLAYSTTYVWKVVAINAYGSTEGPEWTFETQDEPLSPPAAPQDPLPGDGATGVAVEANLDWDDATDAAGYDLRWRRAGEDWELVEELTASSHDLPTLAWNTTYEWQVTSKNAAGSETGPIWSFTTIVQRPGVFSLSSPADGTIDQDVELQLDWSTSARADSYDIYFGTGENPPLAATTSDSFLDRTGLSNDTTYYWRVVAKNAGGTRSVGPFSFTTLPAPPAAPTGPSPATGSVRVDVTPALQWSSVAGAAEYDVYLGTNEVPETLMATVATNSYSPGTLDYSQTYFWKVIARNSGGEGESQVWSFSTVEYPSPGVPADPSPKDGAADELPDLTLNWADSTDATSYDVYLKTGRAEFTRIAADIEESRYSPAGLSYGRSYTWYVVAKNAAKSTPGPEWTFETQSFDLGYQDAGHWTFDSTLGDSSGFAHHGEWRPEPAFTHAVPGSSPFYTNDRDGEKVSAVALNAQYTQYVLVPLAERQGSALANHTFGFSLSLWYREAAANQNTLLVSRLNQKSGYDLVLSSGKALEWYADGELVASVPESALSDEWNHIAISWDFETEGLRIWANGTPVVETKATPFTNSTDDIYFGPPGPSRTSTSFTGILDDIRIYYRAISETEAKALFN